MDKPFTLEDVLNAPHWETYAERRREVRYACSLAGTVCQGEQAIPAEILSLSRGGISARVEGKLEKDALVEVRVDKAAEAEPLRCRVVWASPTPGLVSRLSAVDSPEVSERSWLDKQLEELGALAKDRRQRRGTVRVRCEIPARLGWAGHERTVVLRDLGTSGARVETEGEPLPLDHELRLTFGPLGELPEVSLEARSVGTHDSEAGHYGLMFTGDQRLLIDYMNEVFTPRRALPSGDL